MITPNGSHLTYEPEGTVEGFLESSGRTVIVDVEATPARTYDEVKATETMIERTERILGLKPERLLADTAYGTGRFLGWLAGAGITPHIPVWEKAKREDGTFSRSDFAFDKQKNEYRCPNGKALRTTGRVHDGRTVPLSGEQARLRSVPVEDAVLSERPVAQDTPGCERRGA